jgi:hypothetical protein
VMAAALPHPPCRTKCCLGRSAGSVVRFSQDLTRPSLIRVPQSKARCN